MSESSHFPRRLPDVRGPRHVHHGILDGDIAFLGKPFTPDALVLKIVEVLHKDLSSSQSLERLESPTPNGSKEEVSYSTK